MISNPERQLEKIPGKTPTHGKCHYEVIIVGAGPAGMCAAISNSLALQNSTGQVLLLDGNPHPGKKLLLSGSGQCNLTHGGQKEDFLRRLGSYAHFLKPAYYAFDNNALIGLLNQAGCPSMAREDGKVFPVSHKAADVLTALVQQAQLTGVKLMTSARVTGLEPLTNQGFKVHLEHQAPLSCNKLILATGGASYPQTGSDGFALQLTTSLGHHPVAFRPHLTGVSIRDFIPFSSCAGISLSDVEVKFITPGGGHKAKDDILITHQGFSGPVIMDNSHLLSSGDEIIISWLKNADTKLQQLKTDFPRHLLPNALVRTGIPRALLDVLVSPLAGYLQHKLADYGKQQLAQAATLLSCSKHWILNVSILATAMASAGGIPLSEVNAKTMQSRICPGLFFAGEILDYALPTGGFNIQMACSTGWLAGLST